MTATATIGQVGNTDHENVRIGKAGRKRHMGIRPTVRGVGHEPAATIRTAAARARAPVGMPAPDVPRGASPRWASRPASIRKYSDKMIVKRAGK